MDEQRHINLLEAFIDNRLTADERRELEGLLVQNAAMRKLFWETMQQHAFTQELLSEAQGRSIALTESRAATLESLKQEAARITAAAEASASASAGTGTGAAASASAPLKAGRSAKAGSGSQMSATQGTRRIARHPATTNSRMFWMVLAALLLLTVGVGGWVALNQAPQAQTGTRVSGIATLDTVGSAGGWVIRGTTSLPMTAPFTVNSGDLLQTNPGAKDATASALTYADGSKVQLAAGTSVTLTNRAVDESVPAGAATGMHPSLGKRLELDGGVLTASVAPQQVGQPMILITPHAHVLVVGTQFTLAVSGEKTRLTVKEGHVQFARSRDGEVRQVLAQQYVEAGDGIELAVKAVEEPRPVVAVVEPPKTEPKHEPEHPVPHGDELGTDEVGGKVTEVGDKGATFTVQVLHAGNHEMIGRAMQFVAGWSADRKQPKEADVRQIHELRVGDTVRIHYFFEEHYRFRTLTFVERVRRDEPKPHEPVENHDGKETKDGSKGPEGKAAAPVEEHSVGVH